MVDSLRFGIVGCGLMGNKRAKYLPYGSLKLCVDSDINKAQKMVNGLDGASAIATTTTDGMLSTVDAVFICTPNAYLAPNALKAISAGKHVFIEKPGGISTIEIVELMAAATENNVKVRIGYNHRYHPAIMKARKIIQYYNGIGQIMFIRGRYGHGGRRGYNKEWRSNLALSGGGETLDQGSHLIDLSLMFLENFNEVGGFTNTYFWDMPVEDNGFMWLRTKNDQMAFLHASCTEWRNMFSFEIYGRTGKLQIEGLGGSYGIERLSYYKMSPDLGIPDITHYEYPKPDNSWGIEYKEFYRDITENRSPEPGLYHAGMVLDVVEKVYKVNR